MLALLFLFFINGAVVNCDDSRQLRVYWNVPTMQCQAKKIPFKNLYEKYGIIQNERDSFNGDKITILYDPGLFPALLRKEDGENFKFRNGGVPQEGDLDPHIEAFRKAIDRSIPDQQFNGLGVIDFESWRPIFRQNGGSLDMYRQVSLDVEAAKHPRWPQARLSKEASARFEAAAQDFMASTLSVAKEMRPDATWGYYGFPYCFNMVSSHMKQSCADGIQDENDDLEWLWSESNGLYPSVYSSKRFSLHQLAELIRGRVQEAKRVKSPGTVIIPYLWFKYLDGGYLSAEALETSLKTLHDSKVSGIIIWGSSADVKTAEKCESLKEYLEEVMGPAVAKYTKPSDESSDDDPSVSQD